MKWTCLLLLPVLITLSACRSFREVPIDHLGDEIERGDVVRVTDLNDALVLFEVTDVDDRAIAGEDVHFRVSQIQTIEREGIHTLHVVGETLQAAFVILRVSGALGL